MSEVPTDLKEFNEYIVKFIKRTKPDFVVNVISPEELHINGRRLVLEDLRRMVVYEPSRGTKIVEHFLDQLFLGKQDDVNDISWENARARILPRIQPVSIFEALTKELVAHIPYVNDTAVVFVLDMPHMTVSITTEQLVRWGVTIEEMHEIALENLDSYAPELDMGVIESAEGGRAVIVAEQDGYDAARLCLSDLYNRLAGDLGQSFYVATPARDLFIACSVEPKAFVDRLCKRISEDFNRLPYPITEDLFLVTQDGVAGTLGKPVVPGMH